MIKFAHVVALTNAHLEMLKATRPPETLEQDAVRWAFLVTDEELATLVSDIQQMNPGFMTQALAQAILQHRAGLVLPNGVPVLPELSLVKPAAAAGVKLDG